ncbi:MAG: MMPL family transporter, partial [Spirochaetales bacterium]|nr:MMPL family transporter [Spirochaetales bacterium]
MNWIIKHSKLTIGIVLVITAILGFQIKDLVIDNDVNNFFPKENYTYQRTKAIDDIYGSQVVMDIAITSKKSSFLTKETIEVIKNITQEIELLEYVNEVTSLTNTDFPQGTEDGMVVEKLVGDSFEGSQEELADLKNKLLDWPDMYRGFLYSDDFKSTQILTVIDHHIESDPLGELYVKIKAICDKYSSNDLIFSVAGSPVVNEVAKTFMYTDLAILIPFVILVILFSLFISFKRFAGTVLPLITVVISTVWTVGIMAMTGFTFTVVTTCLPVLLIAVGSAFGIHIISHYYHELEKENGTLGADHHNEVIVKALKKVRKPVVLAALTTILGFLSILSSPVGPLKTFGLFSAIGVLIALFLSMIFIPALLSLNKKAVGIVAVEEDTTEKNFLTTLYNYFSKKTPRIVFITLVLIGCSVYGIKNLNIESSLIKYFPEDSIIRTDNQLIVDKFSGTNAFSIEIRGSEKGDLTDPQILERMDQLSDFIKMNNPEIGKVLSFSDYIKRINKVMNYPLVEDVTYSDSRDTDFGFSDDSGFSDFFGDLESDNEEPATENLTQTTNSNIDKYNK